MKAELEPPTQREKLESEKPENPERRLNGYEMVVGNSDDSVEARNEFIDEVEKLLEFESLERGQKHLRKNFEHAAVHSEMFELEI